MFPAILFAAVVHAHRCTSKFKRSGLHFSTLNEHSGFKTSHLRQFAILFISPFLAPTMRALREFLELLCFAWNSVKRHAAFGTPGATRDHDYPACPENHAFNIDTKGTLVFHTLRSSGRGLNILAIQPAQLSKTMNQWTHNGSFRSIGR